MIYLLTIFIRAIQAFIDAAPTLLFGIMAAAYLRMVIGPEGVRRLFGGEGARGLWRASLLASLAPVCSLGVLPIARELRRAGVSTAKVMSFTLAAPLLNPITLCYGWTVLDIPVFGLIVAVSFLFSFVVGGLTARWLDDEEETMESNVAPPKTVGARRMLNLMISASWLGSGEIWKDVTWALLVTGLAAAMIPSGYISQQMVYTNPLAPPLMAAIATPAFVSPTLGVMQCSAMSNIQFSLGAVVALHILGVGLNAAVIRWIHQLHGTRRLISLGLVAVGLTLIVGYAADFLMDHPAGGEVDTLALETFAQVRDETDRARLISQVIQPTTSPANYVGVIGIMGLLVAGIYLRRIGINQLPDVAEAASEVGEHLVDNSVSWDRPLPKPFVAAFAGSVLFLTLILVVYVYYPPVPELFEEMSNIRADAIIAVKSKETGIAKRELAKWHSAADKLSVSAKLRLMTVESNADLAARELCSALRSVEESMSGSKKVVEESLSRLEEAFSRAKTAYGRDRGFVK